VTSGTGATDPLPARFREAREFLGLPQQDVGKALGIPRSSISAIEHGQRNVAHLELRRFARLYRRPVAWLLGEDVPVDEVLLAAARDLSERDRAAVLKLAEFFAASRRRCPNAGVAVALTHVETF
jgi:transcriptional regulator with XRE-family HTH domain